MMFTGNTDPVKEEFITAIREWFLLNPKTRDKVRRMNELVTFEQDSLLIQIEALDGQYVMKYFNRDRFKENSTLLAGMLTEVLKNRMKIMHMPGYQLHMKVKYLSYLYEKRIQLSMMNEPD